MTYRDPEQAGGRGGTEETPAGLVSLRTIQRALHRRRALLLVTAVLGLVVGAGFHSAVPRKYVAMTSVYLVEPAGSDPQVAYATDASLLQTRTVAAAAIAAAHLDVPVTTLLASYRGEQNGTAVMSIRLSAPTPAAAIARDNAVAAAFLAFRATEVDGQTQAQIAGMQSNAKALQSQITDLSRRLQESQEAGAGSALGRQRAQWTTEQTVDVTELAQLQGEIQQDQLDVITVSGSSRVIDAAALEQVSQKKVIGKDALTGLVGGLGAGVVFVALAAVLSDRLRDRRDVADALAAPVELSIGDQPKSRVFHHRRLVRRLTHPHGDLQLVVTRLRSHLDASVRRSLIVVTIGAEDTASLAVGLLGAQLAAEGRNVLVADMADGRPLSALLEIDAGQEGAQAVEIGAVAEPGRGVHAVVLPKGPARLASLASPPEAEVVVVLATIDSALGADHLRPWAESTVVVLGAGEADTTHTRTVGQLLRNAGLEVCSAILVGADPDDESLGMVVQASGSRAEEGNPRPVAARSAR